MRLRIMCNTRKCLNGLILLRSTWNLQLTHFLSISCRLFCQAFLMALIVFVAIWTIITLPLVIKRAFDYRYGQLTQMDFRPGGNEIEYFKEDRCVKLTINRKRAHEFGYERNLWTRVTDTVYVYNAYMDTRKYFGNVLLAQPSHNLSLIRIIGIIRMPPLKDVLRKNPMQWFKLKDETFLGDKYFCKVFKEGKEKGNMVSTRGHTLTYTIIEEGVKIFSAALFNCYINESNFSVHENEIYVALYPVGVDNYPDKLLLINRITERSSSTSDQNTCRSNFSLSVCVRPLFGPMDDLPKLVQFLSYYFSMGVHRFTFYDLSISPGVEKYLKRLQRMDKIKIILKHWNLPTGNVSELWDFGTLAALNDCLYNDMDETRVIFVDIDEYIVPQLSMKTNLSNLLANYGEYHQLLVRNTFFCKEFCPMHNNMSSLIEGDKNHSVWTIFTCLTRTKKIWNANLRGKYIVDPTKIVSVGHHLVTKYVNQVDHRFTDKSLVMRTDVALLYHYRHCRSISTSKHPILNRLTVKDKTINKFRELLQLSLPYSTYKEFKKNTTLIM